MDIDDLEPRKTAPAPRNLEALSIVELEDYIVGLEAEIERAKAAITAKRAVLSGARSLFRR